MTQRILNILGWVGTAIVLAAVFIWLTQPDWYRYAMYMAWTGLVLVLLYPISQWREIASQMSRRQSKYATMTVTSVAIVLGILVAVNYLSNRRNTRWDLTEGSIHSLSEQSVKVLEELEAPLRLVVIDRQTSLEAHRDRMSMYDGASNQVTVEYLDALRDPLRTKEYGIEVVPTIVAEYMGRTEKITTVDEREITSAIIRVITGAERKVYFVQGHGERDPKDQEGTGYAGAAGLLGGDNVAVETLVLTQSEIPSDATVVAIIGPTADFLDSEIDRLREYLTGGGKLLLAVDPPLGERPQPLTKLTALAREWGIDIGNDVVLDVSGRSNVASFAVAAPPYPSHPITEGYGLQTIFPLARSVAPVSPAPEGKTVQPFVETAANAWAESDIAGLEAGGEDPEMNPESGDIAGPVVLGTAVTAPVERPAGSETPPGDAADGDDAAEDDEANQPQTRIAAFGDADFASNDFGGQVGNADLFLNTVSWLTTDENLIAIRPREQGDSNFSMTERAMNVVWWLSILIVPAVVVVAGFVSWSRRRRV